MDSTADVIKELEKSPSNVKFVDLCKICDHYFGEARQKSSSHRIYKTPWPGDPRVNIQEKSGKGKDYQVKQVIKAIKRLEVQSGNRSSNKK
ncbi:toxin HicA [Chloroflexota bacterium]